MVSKMVLYLSVIFICSAIISLSNIFLYNSGKEWHYVILLVLLAVIFEIIIDIIFATIMRWIVPKKFASIERKNFYSASKKEQRFYEKIGIKKWKDKVLELGAVTGFRKNKLGDTNDIKYVERFIVEANYGILVHIACMIFGFLIIFICPRPFWFTVGLPVGIVNLALNFMSNSILRYNLPKLHTLYKFNLKRQAKKQAENHETN